MTSLKIKNVMIDFLFLFFEFNLVRSVDDDNDGIGRLTFGRVGDEIPNSARRKINYLIVHKNDRYLLPIGFSNFLFKFGS